MSDAASVKAFFDLGLSLAKVAKAAKADGWDASKDLPVIVTEAVKDVIAGIDLWPAVEAEAKSNPLGSVKAVLAAVVELVQIMK